MVKIAAMVSKGRGNLKRTERERLLKQKYFSTVAILTQDIQYICITIGHALNLITASDTITPRVSINVDTGQEGHDSTVCIGNGNKNVGHRQFPSFHTRSFYKWICKICPRGHCKLRYAIPLSIVRIKNLWAGWY